MFHYVVNDEAHKIELPVSVSRGIAASEYAYDAVNKLSLSEKMTL